ncbi:7TM diverse intracellular signaling domain-containing protein [Daejeonella sp.]|uniref:sensor histidine kinase n=1 Tax=Daejeonella sp. TaxID=2805397 RepID=UPI0030BC1108
MIRFASIIMLFLFSDVAAASKIHILEDKSLLLSSSEVLTQFNLGKSKEMLTASFNAGFTKSVYWLIIKSDPENLNHKLIIGNAHINKLEFYIADGNGPRLRYITGDHFPFAQRPVNNRLFIFPLEAKAESIYLVKVDKRDESLQLEVQILSSAELYQKAANENLITGILWGIILLVLVFVCFMFVTIRESLYLHYLLYIIIVCLWIVADKGYGYQFIWSDYPDFASRARPIFNTLWNIMIIQLMQSFLNQSKASPFYKPLNVIKIASFLLGLAFLISPVELHKLSFWFLGALFLLGGSTIVLLTVSIIEQILKGNKPAWFYMISVFMLIVFSITELFIQSGNSNMTLNYLSNYGIQTGLVTEIIILNFGLAHRFNSYKNDKENLLIEVNKKQNELTTRIIETQEIERRKIADQLHDDVGSMLSLAILQISSIRDDNRSGDKAKTGLEKTIKVLGNVSDTIRNMSHTLTPIAIEKYGFRNAIVDLLSSINLAKKIHVEYIILGFENTQNYKSNLLNDLYRIIVELLNNVIKHSQASHCLLQLVEHEDVLSIMIEDNGKGTQNDLTVLKNGMGLNNIKLRVEYFKGRIELSEKIEGGTLVNIEIPVNTIET